MSGDDALQACEAAYPRLADQADALWAVYLGTVTVQDHTGSAPMSVTFGLRREVPMEVFAELTS